MGFRFFLSAHRTRTHCSHDMTGAWNECTAFAVGVRREEHPLSLCVCVCVCAGRCHGYDPVTGAWNECRDGAAVSRRRQGRSA